jgi:ERCC4-type nuclease
MREEIEEVEEVLIEAETEIEEIEEEAEEGILEDALTVERMDTGLEIVLMKLEEIDASTAEELAI